jgi:type IV secretion system protein VirB10
VTEAAVPTAAPKLDPETLAIRTRPPRAIRFKRGVIIAIAAFGSVSLMVVTWMALKPRFFHVVDTQEELSQPYARPSTDALSGAPATYGDVPRLGPPLPGDLGKPILEHEQVAAMAPIDPSEQQLQQAEATERDRQLSELKAARKSGVLVQGRGASQSLDTAPTTAAASTTGAEASGTPRLALDPERDPNAQAHKADFVAKLDPRGDVNPHGLLAAPSPYMLQAGSVISASLITGLRSDLPGLVTAQVTENTYDSVTGRTLLIPQGARLIGNYDSVVAFGQKRALVVWQRIIMPDGSSLRLDNEPATDSSGYSGLADKVDLHTWQLLKGVALSTLIGIAPGLALSGQGDLVQAIRLSTVDSSAHAVEQITQRNVGVQPSITIRPGAPVRLLVHKDLVLAPWKQEYR